MKKEDRKADRPLGLLSGVNEPAAAAARNRGDVAVYLDQFQEIGQDLAIAGGGENKGASDASADLGEKRPRHFRDTCLRKGLENEAGCSAVRHGGKWTRRATRLTERRGLDQIVATKRGRGQPRSVDEIRIGIIRPSVADGHRLGHVWRL